MNHIVNTQQPAINIVTRQ